MLIQKYYYLTNLKKCARSKLPQSMEKVLEKLHAKQQKQDDQDLTLEVWKRLFTSTQLGDSTTDLCNTFLGVIKKLRTTEILSSSLEAFLARCLIPLEKNPGLRTIGVREVLRRISGKVIVMHARDDSVTSVGSLQVCTEHEAGCESMIHAMRTEFMKNNQLKQYYW